jgi:hypothetical protein
MMFSITKATLLLLLLSNVNIVNSVDPYYRDRTEMFLEPCGSSGLKFASNRGYPATWDKIGESLNHWSLSMDDNNERAKSVENYFNGEGWDFEHIDKYLERKHAWENKISTSVFTYIDKRYGAYLREEDVNKYSPNGVYGVLGRPYTNYLCDKEKFALAAKKHNLEGIVTPYSWFSKQEAYLDISLMDKKTLESLDVFFIKDFHGTYGSGIDVIKPQELGSYEFQKGHLIQQGLTKNIYLHEGHKVTFRGFLIIMHGSLYVHKHAGWSCTQEELFDPKSNLKEVQISHHDIELKHLENFTNYELWTNGFVDMAKKAGPMFEDAIKETSKDPTKFSFLGVDLIPFTDGSVMMLEVNSYPSFRRPDVMIEIILRLFGLIHLDPKLDSRMEKVWTYTGHDGNEL